MFSHGNTCLEEAGGPGRGPIGWKYALVGIVALGAFLRVYGISDRSFWKDEGAEVMFSQCAATPRVVAFRKNTLKGPACSAIVSL